MTVFEIVHITKQQHSLCSTLIASDDFILFLPDNNMCIIYIYTVRTTQCQETQKAKVLWKVENIVFLKAAHDI